MKRFLQGAVELGTSIYADDIARKLMLGKVGSNGAAVAHRAISTTDKYMRTVFGRHHYKPNNDKRVVVPRFVGEKSETNLRKVVKLERYIGKIATHARYLGPQFTASTLCDKELVIRVKCADMCYGAMGSFWFRGPRRFARSVFKAVVCNTVWSAMEAFVLVKQDYETFDKKSSNMAAN